MCFVKGMGGREEQTTVAQDTVASRGEQVVGARRASVHEVSCASDFFRRFLQGVCGLLCAVLPSCCGGCLCES